ncbi:hypothetical protein [Peribacillus acanthi]|uniref:hypothetical protein n=1 Tax=Peribacillus acanthi TaxID=2171554 RepID=UPI00130063DB|nr:hypothetical protein [Peribacillus acanthi]
MFLAWLMIISIILVCIFSTLTIFNRLKEIEEYEIANFQSQFKKLTMNKTEKMKQAV